MRLRPPRTTRTDTLFPVTSLFRSAIVDDRNGHRGTPFGPLPGARPGSTPAWPDRSERALGGGHGVGLARIDPDGLAKRAGQTLEAGLDDMVVVGAVEVLHVQRQAGVLGKGLKPLLEQLGIPGAGLVAVERHLPDQVGTEIGRG